MASYFSCSKGINILLVILFGFFYTDIRTFPEFCTILGFVFFLLP